MKLTPRRVLALWRRDAAWRAPFNDVRHALSAKKTQSAALKAVLDDLVRQGALTYHRNTYRLAAPAPAAEKPAPRSGGRPGTKTPAPADAASRPQRERPASPEGGEPLIGVFSAHPNGYGFVAVPGRAENLFIPPRRVGGALDGDRVRAGLVRRRGDERLSGRILEVVERRREKLRGQVHRERGETWVLPLNQKIPAVFLEPGPEAPADGRVVEVALTAYPEDSQTAPTGRILSEIEDADSPEAITAFILGDLNLPTDFSPQAQKAAEALRAKPPPPKGGAKGKPRRDLTALPFVTIDGADARDFDDAVCLERTPEGGYRLWVAIADVAEFVRPGNALDGDGYRRGTSVYFPARVVPMLPEALSNDLCSLRPGEPRLTLTCEMELDAAGEVVTHEIYESTIRSQARLTYGAVAAFLDTGTGADLGEAQRHGPMLSEMLALSRLLEQRRAARGALGFVFPEARFRLDADGLPVEILKALPNPATKLIEQFMLEANETVARHCTENGIPILHRVHDPPPPDQVTSTCEQLKALGVGAKPEEFAAPATVMRVIARAARHPAREQVELVILKAMSQAQYRPSADGHFGLSAAHYTHFTSPIRRFPDLLVHRALKTWLHGGKEPGAGLPPLALAGAHLSERERAAGDAENRVAKLYRVLFMEPHLGEEFRGIVSGAGNRGLWVTLDAPFVEGFLPQTSLPAPGRRPGRGRGRGPSGPPPETHIGKRVTVQLARADRLAQELEFAFRGWGWGETAPA